MTEATIRQRAYRIWFDRQTRIVRYGPMAAFTQDRTCNFPMIADLQFEPTAEQDWHEAERQLSVGMVGIQ